MIFRSLPLFLLLFACSQKESSVRPHERELVGEKIAFNTDASGCSDDFAHKNWDLAICDMQEKVLSNSELEKLFTFATNPQVLENPEISARAYFTKLVWNLNNHLLVNSDKMKIRKLVETLLVGCAPQDLKQCRRFNVFVPANNTHSILVRYLEDIENTKNLEDVFILAAQSKNSISALPLLKVFSSRAESFLFDERVAFFLKSQLSDDIGNDIALNIRSYTDKKGARLEFLTTKKDIENFVKSAQESLGEMSLNHQVKSIRDTRPQLLVRLGVEKITIDPLVQLFDLVFTRVVSERESSKALLILAQESSVVEHYKNYLRLKMAIELHNNDLLIKKTTDSIDSSSGEFLNKFIERIDPIRLSWTIFRSNADQLSKWISSAQISLNTKVQIKNYIKSLEVTIKNYSEYPHMFYLAYLLSKKNFALVFSSAMDKFNIGAADIFLEIINPTLNKYTWLGYTENQLISKKLAIFNSLAYLLESNLLGTLGIHSEDFFTYILKNLNRKYVDATSRHIERTNDFLKSSASYRQFKNYCEAQKRGVPIKLRVHLEELLNGFLIYTFDDVTFESISFYNEAPDKASSSTSGIMPYDKTTIKDFYEYAQTDLQYVIDVFALIKKSQDKISTPSTTVEQALKQTQAKRQYALDSFKDWSSYGPCMASILQEERKMLAYVLEMETSYLKEVHRDVKALGSVATPDEAQSILKKYQQSYKLEDLKKRGVKPLDRISSRGYIYSRFDLAGRVAHYLKKYSSKYDYDIILPDQIEKMQIYKRNGNNIVNPNWRFLPAELSQESMIGDVYKIYFTNTAFTSWGGAYSKGVSYTIYIENLLATMKTNQTVSMDSFLKEYTQYLEYLKFTDMEREMLLSTKRRSLWEMVDFAQRFLDYRASSSYYTSLYGLYDFTLAHMNEDVLGIDYWVALQTIEAKDRVCSGTGCSDFMNRKKFRKGPLARAKDFFETMKDVEIKTLMFPLSQDLIHESYLTLKQDVRWHEERVHEFMDKIYKHYKPDQRVDVSVDVSIVEPVISLPMLNQVEAQEDTFHLNTERCFRGDANCFEQKN